MKVGEKTVLFAAEVDAKDSYNDSPIEIKASDPNNRNQR
jgi:hypothetical protein